jgi:uncharacterized alkaline shock family protein YloU
MTDEMSNLGSIFVAQRAIATIAYLAAMQSYGVVGLASKNIFRGLANALVKDPTMGVDVDSNDQKITIHLYVIVEYGTNIKSVANSVSNTVKFQVEKVLGMPVDAVNVHVQGLRISNID